MNKGIKKIKLKIEIEYKDNSKIKHNWVISGFMHRKLSIIFNKKFDFRTATEIRDWFMSLLQGVH